jgi:hypothetical protein
MLENRVLRKISGCKKRIKGWRKLNHKEIYVCFFSSPNIITLTKPNRIRQALEITRKGKEIIAFYLPEGIYEGER